jgi:hypothetical protein
MGRNALKKPNSSRILPAWVDLLLSVIPTLTDFNLFLTGFNRRAPIGRSVRAAQRHARKLSPKPR